MNITPKEREAIALIENTADITGDFNKIDALNKIGLLDKAKYIQDQMHEEKKKMGITTKEFNQAIINIIIMENEQECSSQDSRAEEYIYCYGSEEQINNMESIIYGVQMLLHIQNCSGDGILDLKEAYDTEIKEDLK